MVPMRQFVWRQRHVNRSKYSSPCGGIGYVTPMTSKRLNPCTIFPFGRNVCATPRHVCGGVERLQQLNDKATDGWIQINTENAGNVCLKAVRDVTCPTLVVHGAKDVICDISYARYMARQNSNVKLTIFPEGKHNLHLRYDNALHDVIRNFLLDESSSLGDGMEDEESVVDAITYAFFGSKVLSTTLRAQVFDAIATAESANDAVTVAHIDSM